MTTAAETHPGKIDGGAREGSIGGKTMKRTFVYDDTVGGSVAEWPVEVYLSRNERTGTFCVYVRFTDPEARAYTVSPFEDASEFRGLLEDSFPDPESVARACTANDIATVAELGRELLAALNDAD